METYTRKYIAQHYFSEDDVFVQAKDIMDIIDKARDKIILDGTRDEQIYSLQEYAHVINNMYDELSQSKGDKDE